MWVSGIFFKVVIQVVLIFGMETWVVTPHMGRALGIIHNRVDHRLTKRNPWRLRYGGWEYPLFEEVMEEEIWEVGLEVVEVYVLRRKNTVV